MFIALPALVLLISGMFVVTMLAALSGAREDRVPVRRRVF